MRSFRTGLSVVSILLWVGCESASTPATLTADVGGGATATDPGGGEAQTDEGLTPVGDAGGTVDEGEAPDTAPLPADTALPAEADAVDAGTPDAAGCSRHADCQPEEHCAEDKVCVPDVCVAGARECVGLVGIRVCKAEGEGWASAADCSADEHCSGGACAADVCKKGEHFCLGESVMRCSVDGMGYTEIAECASTAGFCVQDATGAACAPHVCTPLERRCSEGALQSCTTNGSRWGDPEPCPEGSYCEMGSCVPQLCAPETRRCFGAVVMACNSDGTGEDVVEDCGASGGTCAEDPASGAACVVAGCSAGETRCVGEMLSVCAQQGGEWGEPQPCPENESCVDGSCEDLSCFPLLTVCRGNAVRRCEESGVGFVLVDDCASRGERCTTGQADGVPRCAKVVCLPGARLCRDGGVAECLPDGTGWSTPAPCRSDEYCADGACHASVCQADEQRCAAATVERCSEDGSGWTLEQDCAALEKVCVDPPGAGPPQCAPAPCEAGRSRCVGRTIETCNDDGSAVVLRARCPDGTYCQEDTTATCVPWVCTPEEGRCEGEVAQVCDGQGSGWSDEGTDCATASEVCRAGACLPAACGAGETRCARRLQVRCVAETATWGTALPCPDGHFCDEGQCVAQVCAAGAAYCEEGRVVQCNTFGSGAILVDDCQARDLHCVEADGGATCKALFCQPGARVCLGAGMAVCDGKGEAWEKLETCPEGTVCGDLLGRPACVLPGCVGPDAQGHVIFDGFDGPELSTIWGRSCAGGHSVFSFEDGRLVITDATISLAWVDLDRHLGNQMCTHFPVGIGDFDVQTEIYWNNTGNGIFACGVAVTDSANRIAALIGVYDPAGSTSGRGYAAVSGSYLPQGGSSPDDDFTIHDQRSYSGSLFRIARAGGIVRVWINEKLVTEMASIADVRHLAIVTTRHERYPFSTAKLSYVWACRQD